MLKIIEKTKLWFAISSIIIIIGMVFLVKNGLNFGIDFKGGTTVNIEMGKDISTQLKQEIDVIVKKYDKNATPYIANETQYEVKSNVLNSENIGKMFSEIKTKYKIGDKALSSQNVGPSIGKELRNKALKALFLATIAMMIYIWVRFEINFGIAAIIALLHDVLITLSVYAILNIPVNTPFIAAMLTIVGYSINDTIVIFDRIRENKRKMRGRDVLEVTNISITETMSRSINTSLTTLITIVCVYIFVPSVREFTFPLIIGILAGAYSSIFIASPLWVLFKKKNKKAIA